MKPWPAAFIRKHSMYRLSGKVSLCDPHSMMSWTLDSLGIAAMRSLLHVYWEMLLETGASMSCSI